MDTRWAATNHRVYEAAGAALGAIDSLRDQTGAATLARRQRYKRCTGLGDQDVLLTDDSPVDPQQADVLLNVLKRTLLQ
jgi:hypothetical protein